jgi:hypothetical protein
MLLRQAEHMSKYTALRWSKVEHEAIREEYLLCRNAISLFGLFLYYMKTKVSINSPCKRILTYQNLLSRNSENREEPGLCKHNLFGSLLKQSRT